LNRAGVAWASLKPGRMPEIFVNDVPQELDVAPETWGDLLNRLDERAARSGVVLSAARFDGVEEPSFRDPDVTSRPLHAVARVEVRTAVPRAFLRECLLEAIQPLQETADTAKRLAGIYRGHDLMPGHEGLKALAADLGAVAVLADMLDGPLAVDLTALSLEGATAAQHLHQLGTSLDALVTAQEAEDWITVADVLEYDLEPAVRRWSALLTMITCNLQ
jgi:hypothetical protein